MRRRIASGSRGNDIHLWDAENGKPLGTLQGHPSYVTSVAFDPEGRRLVSGGFDGVRLWDVTSGREVLTLAGTYGPLSFSPDGRRLLSGGGSGTLIVWDATGVTPVDGEQAAR